VDPRRFVTTLRLLLITTDGGDGRPVFPFSMAGHATAAITGMAGPTTAVTPIIAITPTTAAGEEAVHLFGHGRLVRATGGDYRRDIATFEAHTVDGPAAAVEEGNRLHPALSRGAPHEHDHALQELSPRACSPVFSDFFLSRKVSS